MKEIINNYQDMSLEQLGSSLLGRQATQRAEERRRQSKDERIQKIIGGLLATQAVFGQNAKTKIDQINSGTKMAELGAQAMSNRMLQFGNLVSGLENKIGQNINYTDLNAEEQDLWLANFSSFLDKPFDDYAKANGLTDMIAWNNGKRTAYEEMAPTVWSNIFLGKDGKPAIAQQFYESGSKVFDGAEGEDLLGLMVNSTEALIKQRQQLSAQNAIAKVRGENKITNVWTGIKDAGSYIFGKAEADNIFTSKENYTPFGPDASILREVNFQNILGSEFKKTLSKYYDNIDWSDAASAQEADNNVFSNSIVQQIDVLAADLARKNRQYPNVKGSQMKDQLDDFRDYFADPANTKKPDAQKFIRYYGGVVLKADKNTRFRRELAENIGADPDKFNTDSQYRRLAIFAAVLNDSNAKEMGWFGGKGFGDPYEKGDFQFDIDERLLQKSVVSTDDGNLDVRKLAEIKDEDERASAGVSLIRTTTDTFKKKENAMLSMWNNTIIFDAFKKDKDYTFIDFSEDFKTDTLPSLDKTEDKDMVAGAFESLEKATVEKQMKDIRSMNRAELSELASKKVGETQKQEMKEFGKKISNSFALKQIERFQKALDTNKFGSIGSIINSYSGKNWREMSEGQRRAVVERMITQVTEQNRPIK